jgi:hypothetical protein
VIGNLFSAQVMVAALTAVALSRKAVPAGNNGKSAPDKREIKVVL